MYGFCNIFMSLPLMACKYATNQVTIKEGWSTNSAFMQQKFEEETNFFGLTLWLDYTTSVFCDTYGMKLKTNLLHENKH